MVATEKYLFTQILMEHLMRQSCGRIRALGIKGASYCKAVGSFRGFVIRIPESEKGKLVTVGCSSYDEVFRFCIPETSVPGATGGTCVYPEGAIEFKKRGAWFEIEEVIPNVSYAIAQINHTHDNGDVVFILPQSFRSKASAINWVREVRFPEVANLFDCQMFTTAEASDSPDEHSLYLYLKDKNYRLRDKDMKITFDIQKTETLDNA